MQNLFQKLRANSGFNVIEKEEEEGFYVAGDVRFFFDCRNVDAFSY